MLEKFCSQNITEKCYLVKCCHFLEDDVIDKVTWHIIGLLSMEKIQETLLITNIRSNKDAIKGLWCELELYPKTAYLKVCHDHLEKNSHHPPQLNFFWKFHTKSHFAWIETKSQKITGWFNMPIWSSATLSRWGGAEWAPPSLDRVKYCASM